LKIRGDSEPQISAELQFDFRMTGIIKRKAAPNYAAFQDLEMNQSRLGCLRVVL